MNAIDRLLKLADNEKYSIIDPQDIDDARTELNRLRKIKRAVAELDKCDKAYFQARGGEGVVKLLDDYNNALDALLKVYRGEE